MIRIRDNVILKEAKVNFLSVIVSISFLEVDWTNEIKNEQIVVVKHVVRDINESNNTNIAKRKLFNAVVKRNIYSVKRKIEELTEINKDLV